MTEPDPKTLPTIPSSEESVLICLARSSPGGTLSDLNVLHEHIRLFKEKVWTQSNFAMEYCVIWREMLASKSLSLTLFLLFLVLLAYP